MTDLNHESLQRAATKALHMATGPSWERVHQSVRDGYLSAVREVIREWTAAEAERKSAPTQSVSTSGCLEPIEFREAAPKEPNL